MELLERYLGAELAVYRANGVALTSAGQDYAGRVSAIFRNLRTVIDGVRNPCRFP